MNERSPLLDPTPLKDSGVSTTVDSGKLVGAEPGDLVDGVTGTDYTMAPGEMAMPTADMNTTTPELAFGGFLGRSHGWDR